MIKTFRGMLADGDQTIIRLSTNRGMTGYRIKKFQVLPGTPGVADVEWVTKIFKVKQATVTGDVDFSGSSLLGAAFISDANSIAYTGYETIIFDTEIVNQDIFLTMFEISSTGSDCNYYLELEQLSLDLSEATVATLKDMRGTE